MHNQGTQHIHVLFALPCLLLTNFDRLHANPHAPLDREAATILPIHSGTGLLLIGGAFAQGTAAKPDNSTRDVWHLDVAHRTWARLAHAKMSFTVHSHAAVVISPTKIMIFGGVRNGDLSSDITYFTTDSHKWTLPLLRSTVSPLPRSGHCMATVRERVYMFGGKTGRGLSGELWAFDLEALTW